jgi:hypothetical protein
MATMRSPNYPAVSLRESCQRARLLWVREKRTPVPSDVAAKAIGYAGISGPSRTVMAAMKKYGLVDSDDKMVRVSDLALRILHPADEDAEIKALQEAALKPELFAELYSTHRDASDDALRSYLITRLEFSEAGARQLIKAFRDTISLARLDQPNANPSLELAVSDRIQLDDNTRFIPRLSPDRQPVESVTPRTQSSFEPSKPLIVPIGPDVYAEVRIRGGSGELRAEYIDALREYLILAKKWITPVEPRKETSETEQA